ncbi:methyltransferase family protein [Kribbella orskensis]|uniref:Methyltransferase family protein n=2 Tax=Kribbellaceae TaxID=2726069 RepID=A0ABY2B8C8_9ACTN|nr:methyltransferase family protein [Kribbella sp. VKM Ac-2500]TCO11383.1 methyltransferase family protein [Kribbella orskensis]
MSTVEVMERIRAHYTQQHNEVARLTSTLKGRLELQRVQDLLSAYLPSAPARVADVGGGPGVHAKWLQDRGYDVTLLDPIERHVDEARATGVNAVLGDARRLPWPSESVDALLMAGPIYHLREPSDRGLALREAARVLRPGGLIAVVAINRAANLIGSTLANTLTQRLSVVEEILETGYSEANERMAETCYHSVAQLRGELAQVASAVTVHGLTGPGGWLTMIADAHFSDSAIPTTFTDPDPLETALLCTRLADRHPELVHSSSLLFAVGRRA